MAPIVLLGCAGAGKTTLARRLAAAIGGPAIILDELRDVRWGPAEAPAFRATLERLYAGEAWSATATLPRELRHPPAAR